MKLKELIDKLEEIRKEHGDEIDVAISTSSMFNGFCDIEDIHVAEPSKYIHTTFVAISD